MTIVFTIIFCLSLAAGAALGYITQTDALGYAVNMVIGGFIGSSIIALLFSWLYFFQQETDQEKIERLKQEINELKGNQFKGVKRLE